MTEHDLQHHLFQLLTEVANVDINETHLVPVTAGLVDPEQGIADVKKLTEAGASNPGVVVATMDGHEFEITIVRRGQDQHMPDHLPLGTPVTIDIGQGLNLARGRIDAAEYDEGWLYRIELDGGDRCQQHRNARRELWVCAFEVQPVTEET